MRTFRLATPADLPALQHLAKVAGQPNAELPDLAFLAEQDGILIAAAGLELGKPGMVVLSGVICLPEVYRKAFLAFRLQEFLEDWLIQNKCYAYIFAISKRNTRMQRWMEGHGAKRYAKKDGAYWYLRTLGPHRHVAHEDYIA